jgi:DNA-directed RNA polymerase specialized sigma24 family protein
MRRCGSGARSAAANPLERLVARSKPSLPSSDALEQEAAKAELLRWIDSLQPPYREVMRLHFLEGASRAEIAERLSRPGARCAAS